MSTLFTRFCCSYTLKGVNRPGTEYSCVQYGKIFDGPSDQASIDAMRVCTNNIVCLLLTCLKELENQLRSSPNQ